jgi:hypothetical protein
LVGASFSRFRLALDRQVSEQKRSRFVPQIVVPQAAQRAGFAISGIWQCGQSFVMARRMPLFAGGVKRFLVRGL